MNFSLPCAFPIIQNENAQKVLLEKNYRGIDKSPCTQQPILSS